MFTKTSVSGVDCYVGDPDCAAAYAWIQGHLRALNPKWLKKGTTLGDRRKGNLGEFIAFHVSESTGLSGQNFYCILGNANKPLSASSDPGLDIIFVYFDPAGDTQKDRLYIQEVKTTGKQTLGYADALTEDHKKLQAADSNTNLESRIHAIKGTLKYQFKLAPPMLDRLEAMGHPDPSKCSKVIFFPTLVHERKGATPATKLASVKADIAGLGWLKSNIKPISIALTRLNDNLLQLATNQAFLP